VSKVQNGLVVSSCNFKILIELIQSSESIYLSFPWLWWIFLICFSSNP